MVIDEAFELADKGEIELKSGNDIQSVENTGVKGYDEDVFNDMPEYGSLSNVDTRKWYLEQESKIFDMIDRDLPLEHQARQAFELRNSFRTKARELMHDRIAAEKLYMTDPNLTWEEIINKQIAKGLQGDDIYKEILQSSQRSRKSVNIMLGIEPEE